MARTEEKNTQQYDLWSGFYDQTFGKLVKKRQRRAITELALRPGQRVLDLGIGTGTTLPAYPTSVKVIGVDLSAGMLKQAVNKAATLDHLQCELVQADAMLTPFKDEAFDHILITHVISVVSDPHRLMEEARRLVKTGGRVVILNHFQSTTPAVALAEKAVNPICQRIGWRTDLGIAEVVDQTHLELLYYFKLAPMDVWQIAVFQKIAD